MPVTVTVSNHFKFQLGAKAVDMANDSFILILMATGYTFDKDADATYADISASELGTGFGYTQKTKALTTPVWAEDDVNDRGVLTCDDVSWTASGGAIGPVSAAVLIDDTTGDDTVVCAWEFPSDLTAPDGLVFALQNLVIPVV